MTDETTTTETVTQPGTQVEARIDYGRIERQAKFAATDPEGFDAMRRGYEAGGGTYFKDIEKRLADQDSKIAGESRARAIETNLRKFQLEDSDAEFLTGKDNKEIEAQAKKLRERYDSFKPKDETKEAEADSTTKQQPVLVQYQQQAQPVSELEMLRRNLINAGKR